MSNSFAIKKRPKRFSNVIGHDLIKKTLSATRVQGKIPNSILLHGATGSGKTTLARIYAMYINCSNVQIIDGISEPCGECTSCKNIIKEKCIDFKEINAADQRSIEDMRSIKETTYSSNMDLNYRIFIIDEAQQLPKASQNLLLKVLENDKNRNCFIFCTTNIEKLESPLVNRCMRFDLKKMPTKELTSFLDSICKEESITYEDGVLQEIIYATDGSIRDALHTLEKCSLADNGKITLKNANAFSKGVTLKIIYYLIDNILNCNAYNVYKVSNVMDDNNYPAIKVFNRLIAYLNDVLIYKQTRKSELLQFNNEEYVSRVIGHSEEFKDLNKIRILIKCFLDKYKYAECYPDQKHLLNLGFSESIDLVQSG